MKPTDMMELRKIVEDHGIILYPSMGAIYIGTRNNWGANSPGHRTARGFASFEQATQAAYDALKLLHQLDD